MSERATHHDEARARDQRLFELWSKVYEATPLLGPLLRQLQRQAVVELDPVWGERILDLGGGTGVGSARLSTRLGRHGEVVTLDLSLPMLKRSGARRFEAPIHRVCADALALPFADESFDGILCTNSFHHYPDPKRALAEMRRVLRPGGRLVLVDPSADSLLVRAFIEIAERRLLKLHHVHLHGLAEWRAMLTDAGFARVEVRRAGAFLPTHRGMALVRAEVPSP
ncbi:MAG: methyltransferase domain-containing protein [Deltaproteobacteria bacterium]|nr:MAG: methyltransferase domain-containing protein [Deltaproteobacteria bacterium]